MKNRKLNLGIIESLAGGLLPESIRDKNEWVLSPGNCEITAKDSQTLMFLRGLEEFLIVQTSPSSTQVRREWRTADLDLLHEQDPIQMKKSASIVLDKSMQPEQVTLNTSCVNIEDKEMVSPFYVRAWKEGLEEHGVSVEVVEFEVPNADFAEINPGKWILRMIDAEGGSKKAQIIEIPINHGKERIERLWGEWENNRLPSVDDCGGKYHYTKYQKVVNLISKALGVDVKEIMMSGNKLSEVQRIAESGIGYDDAPVEQVDDNGELDLGAVEIFSGDLLPADILVEGGKWKLSGDSRRDGGMQELLFMDGEDEIILISNSETFSLWVQRQWLSDQLDFISGIGQMEVRKLASIEMVVGDDEPTLFNAHNVKLEVFCTPLENEQEISPFAITASRVRDEGSNQIVETVEVRVPVIASTGAIGKDKWMLRMVDEGEEKRMEVVVIGPNQGEKLVGTWTRTGWKMEGSNEESSASTPSAPYSQVVELVQEVMKMNVLDIYESESMFEEMRARVGSVIGYVEGE